MQVEFIVGENCMKCTGYSPGWEIKLTFLSMNYVLYFLVGAMVHWSSPNPANVL